MNIVQVTNSDLVGRRFNGHDLHLSLNHLGHTAYQFVMEKLGDELTTISIANKNEMFVRSMMRKLEYELSTNNLLFPFGRFLAVNSKFQEANVAHFHLIHNHFLSLYDLPMLSNLVPSIWTVHDPWIVTGHCVHPRECMGWKSGCMNCPMLEDAAFPMQVDKAAQMWELKRQAYKQMNIDIVVSSQFMEDYIRTSPLTSHFKYIHRIPFGIKVEDFQQSTKVESRRRFGIDDQQFVIAFRADSNEIKGQKYILKMLEKLSAERPITLLTVGLDSLPLHIKEKFPVIELGWQHDPKIISDFYNAANVFLMPSLAESFGLMAIEAMASGCPVIVFEDTVLPEITFAPECGIAVPYKNSEKLRKVVERLIQSPDECRIRGSRGKELAKKHYQYEDYVNRHIKLYQEVMNRKAKQPEGGGLL